MMTTFRRIVVGISGGVDSAVCAYLLKKKGYDVHGVFMKNWDILDETSTCTGEKDWLDAEHVCKQLDIPLTQVNFVKEYWNNVFRQFVDDYQNGLTPNPDILCNRFIKFDNFFKYAIENLKADAIATGHYARTSFGSFLEDYHSNEDVRLLQAADDFKDQTFFLSSVNQNALRRTMFPLGTYLKNNVKELAKQIGLKRIALKKESTGICFVGQRNFQTFIEEYLEPHSGNFVDIDTGEVVGTHSGIHQWTVGQRCRIPSYLKPYFVAKKLVDSNTILVCSGTDHPSLYSDAFYTQKPLWIRNLSLEYGSSTTCQFRFQHTKPLVNCTVTNNIDGLFVKLCQPLRAITPGQYAVFYNKDECLGCARIITQKCIKTSELEVAKIKTHS